MLLLDKVATLVVVKGLNELSKCIVDFKGIAQFVIINRWRRGGLMGLGGEGVWTWGVP